ncbi:hypothetical protein RO3G_04677 [Rhizopus delemar RA 99-880]|uniref:Transposase Tc1-like domain-containing protein n=1 Tax=Rhizopus delemar (strain RA 99-880 / ATCC MYA-4621 / FGSC 9543 / NRRL 43880) TaxID=246409 RepID=I1BUU2_RHIO9|nr:hypothetical protein RO3G_04677 [Rhizopus delemar RA 99-880]|eukprot:EIE79972.1 hypothetical protein RO3G_04677 [Rhizopus delemar RA 99-880]
MIYPSWPEVPIVLRLPFRWYMPQKSQTYGGDAILIFIFVHQFCPLHVMRPNGGRSKVLSAADEHYYVRQLTKNCVPSAVKVTKCLENDIGKNVGIERVHKVLRKTVLGAIEKLKKPLLSAKNIRNKLSWCIAHSNSTVDD